MISVLNINNSLLATVLNLPKSYLLLHVQMIGSKCWEIIQDRLTLISI